MASSTGMACQELVELVTAYLDDGLPPAERGRCDDHLRACAGCGAYVGQMRLVVGAIGALRPDEDEGGDPAETAHVVQLFRTHGLHNGEPRERRVPLGVADSLAAPGDHVGYLWEDERELDATADFLATGLERDEMCVLLATDAAHARVVAGLEARGFHADDLRRRDRFHSIAAPDSPETVLRELDERVRSATDAGVPMMRVLGHLGWNQPGWPAERDILSLEARLTDAIRKLPTIVVCAYDVRGLSGRQLLLGGLECHPLTLRRGALRRNEHYVPAQPFLERLSVEV